MEATYQRPFPQTRMHLDGFNEELHLAFEHHGRQHYELNKKFHKSQQDLHEQIKQDIIKNIRSQENLVTLVTIPYFVTDKGIEETKKICLKS
jgi:hypothetical protein